MKAVISEGNQGPEKLSFGEVPTPAPGPGEVRVRVRASALNRADLLQVKGLYPPPPGVPQNIPGMEYAGEVDAVGEGVELRKVGDRVMGIVGGGAFAEALVTRERETLAIPGNLAFEQAAAIPEAFLTAFDALVLQARFGAGDFVLIHAVTSGVGTAAVQLVHRLGGTALGTGRSAEKLKRCESLGLKFPIEVKGAPPTFEAAVREATGDRGVDIALDLVGGQYLPQTLLTLAPRGRVMCIGTLDGTKAEVNLGVVLRKRLEILGTVLRSRPAEERMALARTFEKRVVPLFGGSDAKLHPVIGDTLPFTDIKAGFDKLARNETFGKLVLSW